MTLKYAPRIVLLSMPVAIIPFCQIGAEQSEGSLI